MGGQPSSLRPRSGTMATMSVVIATISLECEALVDGFLSQPANSVTSLAFVAAAIAIARSSRVARRARYVFAALVAATGAGSVIEHGPNPPWADLAHDLPLVALIAYIAVDAAADLTSRRLPSVWWLAPTLALAPLVLAAPRMADLVQVVIAAIAIGLSAQRARVRPPSRRSIVAALSLLGVGGLIGTLSRSGWPLCRPDDLVQGHAVWHVFAALALWMLAPVVGRPTERGSPSRGSGRQDLADDLL